MSHARRGSGWLFLGLAVAALAVFFWDAIARGHVLSQADLLYQFAPWTAHRPPGYRGPGNPLLGDVPMQFYPHLLHAVDAIRRGQFPLWAAGLYSGYPLFAAAQSAVLSPFTWLALVVPLPGATVLIAATRLLVGGVGMYVFIGALGLGRAARTFAGLAYLLNPFSVVWLEHPHSATAAWLPWLLFCCERTVQRGGVAWAVAVALVTGLVLTSGHPETAAKVLLFAAVFSLLRVLGGGQPWRRAGTLLAGWAAGTALAAVQLVPLVELLGQTRVWLDRSTFAVNPFTAPPATLITALVPGFFGNPAAGRYVGPSNYNEQLIYAGVATWLLAAVGVSSWRRDRRVQVLAALGVLSAAIMYGVPGVIHVVSRLPLLRLAALSRFGLIVIATAMVLAAFGVEALVSARRDSLTPRMAVRLWGVAAGVCAAACVAIFVSVIGSRALLVHAGLYPQVSAAAALAIGLLLSSFLFVLLRANGRLPAGTFAAGVIAVIGIDLMAAGRGYHPMIPPSWVFPQVPAIEAVRRDPGVFRVTGWGNHLLPNSAMAYGLQDVRGHDGVGLARYWELLTTSAAVIDGFHQPTHFDDPRLLDLLGVKYVFVRPGLRLDEGRYEPVAGTGQMVYRNTRAFPRAFLVDRYQVEDGPAALRILRDGSIDFRRVVLLERDPDLAWRPEAASENGKAGEATVTRYEDQRVEIETRSDGRRLLVLMDTFYPGWRAEVDGAPSPIVRANHAFRAVPVAAGRHLVRFTYRPASFRAGLVTSAATAVGLLLVSVVAWRGRLRHLPAGTGTRRTTS